MGVVWAEFCTLLKYFSMGNTAYCMIHSTAPAVVQHPLQSSLGKYDSF